MAERPNDSNSRAAIEHHLAHALYAGPGVVAFRGAGYVAWCQPEKDIHGRTDDPAFQRFLQRASHG